MDGRRLALTMAFAFCLAAAGCSSERKLSHVESRVPAAANARAESVSALRSRLSQPQELAGACPLEVRELLAPLAGERVRFPPCPERVLTAYQAAKVALSLEESTAIEELANVQCRVNPREGLPDVLDGLMQGEGLRRAAKEGEAPAEGLRLRDALRSTLLEMRATNAPLDEWVRNNGDFVFPEEQLEFFDRLAGRDACRMPDQEVDLSYRTLRSLEELARIEADSEPQRARIERFLAGVHRVIDRKIQEFFRR